MHQLIAQAEVVLNNLRGDLPAKLGLDYATLSALKPSLVCVHLSAYGRDNERAAWPGYDYLMQAESGLMDLTGEPDGPPTRIGAPVDDRPRDRSHGDGRVARGARAGARHRPGCDVDTCLFDVALHQLGYAAIWYLNEGYVPARQARSAHFSVAPVQTFPSADGWIFVMCLTDKFWKALLGVIERQDLDADPRYATQAARQANRERADRGTRRRVPASQPTRHWLDALAGVLPIAPVYSLEQALESPFLRTNEMIRNVPHPARPDLRMLANPLRINGQRLAQRVCPPVGADNDAVLGRLAATAK